MSVIWVNQQAVPSPSALAVSAFDVNGTSERNARGDLVIDRVAEKRRLDLEWAHLTPGQMAALLTAVGGNAFFEATYPDPQTGGLRTMTCCAEERSAAVLRMEGGAPVWRGLKMRWIER